MQKNQTINRKILKHLGVNIKFYCTKLNLSQETLAFDINVDRTYITAIEQGVKSPSIYCLYLIAQRLGVSLKDLLDINI